MIFADRMTCEITGNSAASRKYASKQQFIDEVLHPFGARSTTAGTSYQNTYAWFMTLSGGEVVDGMAFYDAIAFNDLWQSVTP